MPRVESAADDAGVRIPGVYAALLELERERNEQSDRIAARMKAEHGYFMRRHNSRLAERLEAGEPVVVSSACVESALWSAQRRRFRLPFGRGVRWVEVSPDDRIKRAAR